MLLVLASNESTENNTPKKHCRLNINPDCLADFAFTLKNCLISDGDNEHWDVGMEQEAMGYPGIEQAGENIFLFVWHGNKFAGNALRDAIEIVVNGVYRQ